GGRARKAIMRASYNANPGLLPCLTPFGARGTSVAPNVPPSWEPPCFPARLARFSLEPGPRRATTRRIFRPARKRVSARGEDAQDERMTFTDAAREVLKQSGRPLHYKEITELAIEKNLLSHVGKSPEVTMGARL